MCFCRCRDLAEAVRVHGAIVLFAVFAGTVANAAVFATLGLFAREVGLGEFEVGTIFASSGLLFSLTATHLGRMSDRFGRARIMALGLIATALSLALFAGFYVERWPCAFLGLLAARMVYGLFAGGIQPAAIAWMVDATPRERRRTGIASVGATVSLGSVLGPAFTAMLIGFGFAWPVIVAGTVAALAALALAGLAEVPRSAAAAQPCDAPIEGLGEYALLAFVMVLGFGALQPTTAFYVQDRFGLETFTAIRMAGFAGASFAIGAFLMQALGLRMLAARKLMSIGFVICLAGVGGALMARDAETLVAAFAVLGIGFGGAQASLITEATKLGGDLRQGLIAGRLQAAMAVGWVGGALSGTALYGLSIRAPLLIAGAALALCAIRTALRRARTPSVLPP